MPHAHRRPLAPPTRRRRSATALGLLVAALALLLGTAPAEAKGSAKPPAKFTEVVTAWGAGDAEGIVRAMEAKGAVGFQLLEYPLAGKTRSMRPAQARATLRAYFKRLSGVRLVDVTPKRSPANVRLFDYTYKPAGKSARTTRLQVQLKQDGKRLWVLASVTETPRPRS